jgi:hypothetical protein
MKVSGLDQLLGPAIEIVQPCLASLGCFDPSPKAPVSVQHIEIATQTIFVLIPDDRTPLHPAFEVSAPDYFLNELFCCPCTVFLQSRCNRILFEHKTPPEIRREHRHVTVPTRASIVVATACVPFAHARDEGLKSFFTGCPGGAKSLFI